jgi:hypothetical protein
MNLLSIVTWGHYVKLFFLHQLGPIAASLFVLSLFWLKKNKKTAKLLWWMAINYVLFTIIKNKDFRFTLPLLPVVAVVIVVGLKRMSEKWGFWISRILAGFLLVNLLANSFGWIGEKGFKLSYKSVLFGWVDVVNFSGEYPVKKLRREVWPNEEIVMDLERLSVVEGRKIRVLVLINKEEINDNNLLMYRELGDYESFELGSVGTRERFANKDELLDFMKGFDYVLVPDITYEPAPFYGINLEAYKQARDLMLERGEKIKIYRVYEDKNLFLYGNTFVE